jgi:hypothetical protein
MGLHTGEARSPGSDRVDHAPINRCARVKAAGHGGQVLVTQTACDLVLGRLGGGFGLKRLGEFRLRDLAQPELIYQLTHADLPADFPPLKTIHAGNIPPSATSFVGRAEELRAVAQALAQSRLVTLTGVGGVGKTRLSMEVAGQAVGEYPDGCWLCDLAPARDEDTVLRIIAASLGAALRPGLSIEASITEHCQARQMLVVLDNCEQVLDPAAQIAGTLLRECPGVRILATSRQALDIDGEQVFAVGTLAVPEPATTAEGIAMSDAVQLFADRAAAVQRGFQLDQRAGGGRDHPAAGRHSAGDRTGGGAHSRFAGSTDCRSPGRAVPAAHWRQEDRAGASSDPARHHRLVLQPADQRGTAGVRLSRSVHGLIRP